MFSKLERFPKNKNTLVPPVGAYDPKFPDGSHGPVSFKRSPRDKETKVVGPGVGYYDPKYPNYKIKSNHNFSKLISSDKKSKSTNSSTHNITLPSGKKLLDKRRRSKSVENLTVSMDDDLENTISLETSTVSEDYNALMLEIQDLKEELHRKTEELGYKSKIFLNKTDAEQQTDSFANTVNSFSVNMDFVNQLKIVGSELCLVKNMQNAVQVDFNDFRMNISNVLPNFSVESLLSSVVKNHTRELRERFTALDSAHESLMKEFHEVCRQLNEKCDETMVIRRENDALAVELATCFQKIDRLSVGEIDGGSRLENLRREFDDERHSYMETISSLRSFLEESSQLVDYLNRQLREKCDETTKIQTENDALTAKLASFVEKIDNLNAAKIYSENQLENLRREFNEDRCSSVERISSLTSSLEASNQSVDFISRQLREKYDEATEIRKEKDALAAELASCVEKIDSLSVAKTDTEIRLENCRREVADEQRSYVETISSLTASLAESNRSVDLMSLQIREKNDETTAIRKEKDDLAAELASCVEKIANLSVAKLDSENRLENVCHEFDDHRRSLLEKISSLTSSLEEANKSVDYLNEIRKGFDAILVEADEQLFKVMSERACLENKLACFKRNFEENATVEIRELKSEHVRLNVELAEFRLALSDTFDRLNEALINSVQNYNKNVENEKICLINEVNCMLKLVNETKGALFEEKAKLSKMDHDFQQISESLNATKEEITQIRTENEQYVKRQTELEEQLKSTQSLLDAALADVREITKLRQIDFDECKRTLESENVEFKRSLEMLITTKDEFVSQICNENEQLLKEKSELEEQLKSTQKWLEDTRVDVRETKTNLFALVESHKALCERCDALLQSKKEQADAYQRERILLEVREREFDEMLKEIMEKYTALMSHQNHKQKILHVVKLKDICLKTRQENMELRKENQKSKAHIDSLQDKLDKIQGKRRFDPALAFRACGKENNTPLKSVENHK